jgi:hypothetical protein
VVVGPVAVAVAVVVSAVSAAMGVKIYPVAAVVADLTFL